MFDRVMTLGLRILWTILFSRHIFGGLRKPENVKDKLGTLINAEVQTETHNIFGIQCHKSNDQRKTAC
jgi:hypothetical protein